MDCTDIKVLLSGLIDDELDGETRHAAERHVTECKDCRALIDETEATNQLVAAAADLHAPEEGLPRDFAGGVLSRTVYEHQPKRGGAGGWLNWMGWIAAAAAVVMAITIWALDRKVIRPGVDALLPRIAQGPAGSRAPSPEAELTGSPTTSSSLQNANFKSWVYDGEILVEARDEGAGSRQTDRTARFIDQSGNLVSVDGGAGTASMSEPGSHEIEKYEPSAAERIGTSLIASINREDAETLDSVALALDILLATDGRGFAEVERVRQIVEYDELLPKLASARERMDVGDQPAIFAAEAVLMRIVYGPISQEDLIELRATIRRSGLSGRLTGLSAGWQAGRAL